MKKSEKDTIRANELLAKMSPQEKIGQLHQVWGIDLIPNAPKPDDMVRQGLVGSMLYVMEAKRKNELQRIAVEESPSGIPLLFASDVGHGYCTGFPIQLAMASSWDPEVEKRAAEIIAKEASADGLHWTFYPMVDICRDPRWGRIIEGAGEDPYLGAAMAAAQVEGFQGQQIGAPGHLMACAKHMAGYGAADAGRDYDPVNISEAELRNVYLPPFKAAVEAGVGTIMSAYMDLNNVPASGNKHLLQEILRNEWGFDGFVVSDASAIRNLVTEGFAKDVKDAAKRAFKAGVNMDMSSFSYIQSIEDLLAEGQITMEELDNAVRPILEMKSALGLFEHPYVEEGKLETIVSDPKHREEARRAAQRSMVLLKNEEQTLPLRKDIKKLAVIGPLADSQDATEGVIGLFNKPGAVTVLSGIKKKIPDAEVVYAPGPWIKRDIPNAVSDIMPDFCGNKEKSAQTEEEAEEAFKKAIEIAKQADTVVAVMGEGIDMSGEAASRSFLGLPGRQTELLKEITKLGKKVILVLLNGHPLSIEWENENIPAILEAWQPGWEGGNAVADILFGDVNPGGKMPVTVPRNAGQLPMYYMRNNTHRPESANDGLFTSRYWDSQSSPLYAFGHGLSYTTFVFDNLRLDKEQLKIGETLNVRVDVTNTGKVAGDEVAQVYIHQRYGSDSRPMKELKGFERVTLMPGETKTLEFGLGEKELTYWSTLKGDYTQDETIIDIWVGGNLNAELHKEIEVIKQCVEKEEKCYGK